jgi:mono/diheme cytochrome c family protein
MTRGSRIALGLVLARRLAMPRAVVEARNPVSPSPEVLARARAHFADHCASCHGNDGWGRTKLGRSLYLKAPDMALSRTQGRDLVHFVRHLRGSRRPRSRRWSRSTRAAGGSWRKSESDASSPERT